MMLEAMAFKFKPVTSNIKLSTSNLKRGCPTASFSLGGINMETRVALIGIIVGNRQESAKLNEILHEYGQYVVGRMGVPYKDKDINVISLIVDAPQDVISALSGKLGMLPDVSTKTIYPPMPQ